ncbi:MAG: 4Fe-4S binding protein [Candidatus Stahlbacteria bacterium]|nr:4Fe-4S binding protein [Candidatus Stahlbacteria bacterium]
MIANYGYKDGSGEWFISIDTDKCNGCGECVKVCPQTVFEVTQDPNDPFREEPVAVVSDGHRKKIKYTCNTCKPVTNRPPLPCIVTCKSKAITHSW